MSYNGNLLIDNRKCLIVNAQLLQTNGRSERDAALLMLEQVPGDGRITVGGDRCPFVYHPLSTANKQSDSKDRTGHVLNSAHRSLQTESWIARRNNTRWPRPSCL